MALSASNPASMPGESPSPAATPVCRVLPEFGAIYEEYSRPIYYLALRFLGDPTQAEDATHDIFVKVYRKLAEFRGDAALKTWLYRITINHCRNLVQTWHHRHMVNNADDGVWDGAVAQTGNPLRLLETKELGPENQIKPEVPASGPVAEERPTDVQEL